MIKQIIMECLFIFIGIAIGAVSVYYKHSAGLKAIANFVSFQNITFLYEQIESGQIKTLAEIKQLLMCLTKAIYDSSKDRDLKKCILGFAKKRGYFF